MSGFGNFKGYDIEVTKEGVFIAEKEKDESTRLQSSTYEDLKKQIDRQAKKIFKEFKIFVQDWQGKYYEATVTSIDYRGYAFAKSKEKGREKVRQHELILATPSNEKIYKNVEKIQDTIARLEKEKSDLEENFTTVKTEDKR